RRTLMCIFQSIA
ncbi:unnamed protein product, partial [Callosobruchus maculatus]